jgi:aspartokinase-like uncharacterized kinase
MAVRAMDLTSHCLAALMEPDLKVVDHFSEFADVWNRGMTPVLAPFRFLTEVDMQQTNALLPSWRVTSDSIAARIAEFVKAHDLILLKSRDVPPGTSIREAVHLGLIDPMMPERMLAPLFSDLSRLESTTRPDARSVLPSSG